MYKFFFKVSLTFLGAVSWLGAFSQNEFIPNKGQMYDYNGNLHPEILYKLELPGCQIFFKADGIFYQFSREEEKEYSEYTEDERAAYERGDYAFIGHKKFIYQMNLDFVNASTSAVVNPGAETPMVRNYYLAHCPDGITGVKAVSEIVYTSLYPNIDLRFYFDQNHLKNDII